MQRLAPGHAHTDVHATVSTPSSPLHQTICNHDSSLRSIIVAFNVFKSKHCCTETYLQALHPYFSIREYSIVWYTHGMHLPKNDVIVIQYPLVYISMDYIVNRLVRKKMHGGIHVFTPTLAEQ